MLLFVYLEYTGKTDIVADFYAPGVGYDLTDGDALSAEDIQEYVEARNPNTKGFEVGLKLSHWCNKLDVNPAFVLGIAEADSSNGLAGVGRSYKNPGNTKISYERLDQLGIGHANYKGENNFAVFNDWGDGYSAIAVTLANYSYYNMRGQLEPILRTYAGHPNPNYYVTVRGVISELLREVDIKVALKTSDNREIEKCRVDLRRGGKTIESSKADKQGRVNFFNLPRDQYTLRTNCENYRKSRKELSSLSKTTRVNLSLMPNDRAYISGSIERLIVSSLDNEGIAMVLSGEDGEKITSTRTAKDGFYYFGNLHLGKYVVTVEPEKELPTGFYYTKTVDLTESPQEKVDFYY